MTKAKSIAHVSIHASVKDATVRDFCYTFSLFVSIHASVKDATKVHTSDVHFFRVSIHASVKDATIRTYFVTPSSVFQSTHL